MCFLLCFGELIVLFIPKNLVFTLYWTGTSPIIEGAFIPKPLASVKLFIVGRH